MRQARSEKTTPKQRPIAFRLTSIHYEQLAARAADVDLSPGKYARELVLQLLANDDSLRFRVELNGLRKAIETLGEHLAAATIAVLHDAGKAELQEAVAWVHSNLGPENLTRDYPKTD